MTYGDTPPPERARHAQVEYHEEESSRSFAREAFSLLAQAGKDSRSGTASDSAQRPIIRDQGQIESMTLPEGWTRALAREQPTSIGTRSLIEFHAPDDRESKLCVFYRGLPVNAETAANLRGVLKKEDYKLLPVDISNLKDLLRERADPGVFEIRSARTADLNGKRVLMLEGHYKATGYDLKEVIVDTDGTGRVPQEIYFHAPAESYKKHESQAAAAFQSIRWR